MAEFGGANEVAHDASEEREIEGETNNNNFQRIKESYILSTEI